MEQPAVRSRTSPSSTLDVSDVPSALPQYVARGEALTKKGRLLCLGILVQRGVA